MSHAHATIVQFTKMLRNVDRWLEKAVDHAKAKSFDPNNFTTARLAPDQYELVRQVQAAADSAKFVGARLAGKEAPKHPDTEKTMDELRARVAASLSFLETLKEGDFAGWDTKIVPLTFLPGKGMLGADYLVEMGTPNFYFHVTAVYEILRHNGVALGKPDYIGSLQLKDI